MDKETARKAAKYFTEHYNGKYVIERTLFDHWEMEFVVYRIDAKKAEIAKYYRENKSYVCLKNVKVMMLCGSSPDDIDFDNLEFDDRIEITLARFYNPYVDKEFYKNLLPEDIKLDEPLSEKHPLLNLRFVGKNDAEVLDALIDAYEERRKSVDKAFDAIKEQLKHIKL